MIKRAILPVFILISLLALSAKPDRVKAANGTLLKLENTPLPVLEIPKLKKQNLKNGLRLLFLEDHELPVVRGYLFIRTGSLYDPADKVGLASFTGQLLRSGGSAKHPFSELNEKLASLGASIHSGMDREYGFLSFQCLKEDFAEVFGLVVELLKSPAFESTQFELLKLQMIESLRRQNDRPDAIARREFPKLLYGRKHPWARTPTMASIQGLTRQDVTQFYQKYYHPNQMTLALSGDLSFKEARQVMEQVSQGWNSQAAKVAPLPSVEKKWEPGKFLIPKATDQTTLVVGHFGDQRFNPDKFALMLLNEIFGGDSMTSRLGERIRSTLGLTYGIYSRFGLETKHGLFTIFTQTKAPSTGQVLAEIQKSFRAIHEGRDLIEEELQTHQQSILNSLFSQYEPRFNFVKSEARFEYLGYPPNYLQIFKKNMEKVTVADVKRVAKKYLFPEKLKILVVGNPSAVSELGAFKIWEIDKN